VTTWGSARAAESNKLLPKAQDNKKLTVASTHKQETEWLSLRWQKAEDSYRTEYRRQQSEDHPVTGAGANTR
jgi:hypothetical protein